MLWLENKVILRTRFQFFDKKLSTTALAQAVLHLRSEIRLPLAEIVIHINGNDPGVGRTLFQRCDSIRHSPSVFQERFVSFEVEIVDDIDEDQRDGRFIGNITVQIFVSGRHRERRSGWFFIVRSEKSPAIRLRSIQAFVPAVPLRAFRQSG